MHRLMFLAVVALAALGCGGSGEPEDAAGDGLSPVELEHGIGPIKGPLDLGSPDAALAARGQGVFEQKCFSCHKMGERFIGPDLGEVLSRRTPAYVMNMILNPDEMVKRHPVAKQLLAEYLAPMANQNLSQDEARAVLEYIRSHKAPEASRASQ